MIDREESIQIQNEYTLLRWMVRRLCFLIIRYNYNDSCVVAYRYFIFYSPFSNFLIGIAIRHIYRAKG